MQCHQNIAPLCSKHCGRVCKVHTLQNTTVGVRTGGLMGSCVDLQRGDAASSAQECSQE